MKIHRLTILGLIAGLAALAITSCTYDPFFTGASYSGGYGNGYGYGGSNFSTSYFVSTGNSRWAYDPYAGCYYDHTRRAYYDPYLYGYYPVGYRPRYVVGAPHPHGWHRGSNYCPPPSRIRNQALVHYSNRAHSYRSLGRDWSRNVSVSIVTNHTNSSFAGRDYQNRGSDRSRRLGFDHPRNISPSPVFVNQRGHDDRRASGQRSGSERTYSNRQSRQQIEIQNAAPQLRMNQSAPPEIREPGERRGRRRNEIRSLGEG